MENEKNNKGKNRVLILLIIIIVVLLTLVILFATGVIKFKSNTTNGSSKNSVTANDKVDINLSIDNVFMIPKDSINSIGFYVDGTINLSYDESKFAGVVLGGYCLGNEDEKYQIHGPGSGHVFFYNGADKLYLELNIPQNVVYTDGTSKSISEIDWDSVKIKYCKIDKMTAVFNKGTNSLQFELNFEKNFNSDESNITNSETNKSNNELNQTSNTIASELKSRRFMAKNSIDIDSKALFMKVSDNLYFIEVTYNNGNNQKFTTDFLVSYREEKVIFNKLEEEKYKLNKYIDVKNHILKTEIIRKQFNNIVFYDISNSTFNEMDRFSKGINENLKYVYNSKEVSESEYKSKYSNYEKYSFIKFEDNAVELNDENIDKIVK